MSAPITACSVEGIVRKFRWVVFALFCVCFSSKLSATQLKPATARAFQRYVDLTEERICKQVADPTHFLEIDSLPEEQKAAILARLQKGEVWIQSASTRENGGPMEVPGGLVHDWVAIVFIPGGTAEQVLKLSQDYGRYSELYKPDIQDAKLLAKDGDDFHIYYRFYRHAIVTVMYNAEFNVEYKVPDRTENYSFSRSTRIAELQNPGKPDEQEYPVGNDHGYLWRLNLYTRAIERDGGVYVQVEFLALSRTIPALFAWMVNPYVRAIPRDYLKMYLNATRLAVVPASDTH
jgi:hypothetical protein